MSRADAFGLFWHDAPPESKRGRQIVDTKDRPIPPIPDTGWCFPEQFPNLSAAKRISIDVEANDPLLKSKGPGYPRGDSYVTGISVGTDDGYRQYFPIRQAIGPNLDEGQVIRWATRELGRAYQPKVGAKIMYDLEALASMGVEVAGKTYDVQVMAALINENRQYYNLEALGQDYLGEGKQQDELYQWLAKAYGGSPKRSEQAKNIWRGPSALVGPYAESDVDLPLRLFDHFHQIMAKEGTLDLLEMETDLNPMLLAMRRRGVRVNVEAAEILNTDLKKRLALLGDIDIWNADAITRMFDKAGESYPLTAKTKKPSFTKDWLEHHHWDKARLIADARKWDKFRATFLEGYILNSHVNGRIYGQFHPLKGDENGTITGRFSASQPNLQNIPARDEELGPLLRGLFLPEPGEDWVKDDYSQVEFRILAHYGVAMKHPSAYEVAALYRNDPTTDFHVMVAKLCDIARKPAKNINFGLVYCMGEPTMAANLGRPLEEVKPLFDAYHAKLPFVSELQKAAAKAATKNGYVHTILKRRGRFETWEPKGWDASRDAEPLPYEEAVEKWGEKKIKLAGTYKALNKIIQGSAADVMKKAMGMIWKAGCCVPEALGCPLLTVHDELDWSQPRTKLAQEAHKEVIRIMETAVQLTIPLICDSEIGPDWGHVK